MDVPFWAWAAFIGFVLLMLFLDLFVFHRKAHRVSLQEAAAWTVFWVSLAIIFCIGLYFIEGKRVALEFLSGYLLEESLSVDNIFVFVLIFSYFRVPAEYQHRVLFWGILTAVVLRGLMILLGTTLVVRFSFLLAIFGAFLVYTGIRMFRHDDHVSVDPDSNIAVRLLRRIMPVTDRYHGTKFFIHQNGVRMATPLLVVLVLIETSDVIFAIDSIPAVLGITQDPFIVFTS
ncbi:MAG: TerC/Alx family metal homeostasis membrane protein, partial [Ardenticatenales bacterium]|nr:TerC/Alx family metal homeostasis membrane protein [Ardenticatenales bacterium]